MVTVVTVASVVAMVASVAIVATETKVAIVTIQAFLILNDRLFNQGSHFFNNIGYLMICLFGYCLIISFLNYIIKQLTINN